MKKIKNLLAIPFASCLLMLSSGISAQTNSRCIPEEGFWVIVTNKHTKKDAIVQFYNNNEKLIYEEHVKGKNFPLRKKKTICLLRECLDKALVLANNNSPLISKRDWVISEMNKKQSLKDR